MYVVLELCEYNLEEYVDHLASKDQLLTKAPDLIWGLLSGVSHLHKEGVLHMDLKVKLSSK